MPLSQYRVINAEEFAQLLEHLRINLPSSIRESERLLTERDQIVANAQTDASDLVAQAEDHVRELLSDNALIEAAHSEADRVVYESKLMAQQRTQEADDYAANVLQQLADRLNIISQQVDNGLRMMIESSTPRLAPEEVVATEEVPAEVEATADTDVEG